MESLLKILLGCSILDGQHPVGAGGGASGLRRKSLKGLSRPLGESH